MASAEGWQVGDRLATEHDLAARFDVGRTTVREAFKLLEQDGYVRSEQGRGRFLAVPILDRPITRLEGVTEMMSATGLAPTNQVVDVALVQPTSRQRELLGVEATKSVVRLERARSHGDELMVYSVDFFDPALLDQPIDEIDFTGSLFELFERAGTTIDRATAQIQAVASLPSASIDVEGPWLLFEQQHINRQGSPVLLSSDFHRGGAFTFSLIRRRDS